MRAAIDLADRLDPDALLAMHRALLELTIDGIETSREFHLRVMEDEEFRRGEIEIQWLERRLPSLLEQTPARRDIESAAIAAALIAHHDRQYSVATPSAVSGAASGASGNTSPAESAWAQAARLESLRTR